MAAEARRGEPDLAGASLEGPAGGGAVEQYGVNASAGGPARAGDVPASVVEILKATRSWVKFLSILGFIGCGLLVVAGLVLGAAGSLSDYMGVAGGFLSLLYLAIAVLYLFPALYLFRYAKAIDGLVASSSLPSLEDALEQQRKFWRFVGILAIVMIGLYVLIMIGALLAAVIAA